MNKTFSMRRSIQFMVVATVGIGALSFAVVNISPGSQADRRAVCLVAKGDG